MAISLEQIHAVLGNKLSRETIVVSDKEGLTEREATRSMIVGRGIMDLETAEPRIFYHKGDEKIMLTFKRDSAKMSSVGPYVVIYIPQGDYSEWKI